MCVCGGGGGGEGVEREKRKRGRELIVSGKRRRFDEFLNAKIYCTPYHSVQ